jgi:hypothetical protein
MAVVPWQTEGRRGSKSPNLSTALKVELPHCMSLRVDMYRQKPHGADFFSGSFLKFGPAQTPHPPQREGVRGVSGASPRFIVVVGP